VHATVTGQEYCYMQTAAPVKHIAIPSFHCMARSVEHAMDLPPGTVSTAEGCQHTVQHPTLPSSKHAPLYLWEVLLKHDTIAVRLLGGWRVLGKPELRKTHHFIRDLWCETMMRHGARLLWHCHCAMHGLPRLRPHLARRRSSRSQHHRCQTHFNQNTCFVLQWSIQPKSPVAVRRLT